MGCAAERWLHIHNVLLTTTGTRDRAANNRHIIELVHTSLKTGLMRLVLDTSGCEASQLRERVAFGRIRAVDDVSTSHASTRHVIGCAIKVSRVGVRVILNSSELLALLHSTTGSS